MASSTTGSDKGRYIIRAEDAGQLADFINDIGSDPSMVVVDAIGPLGQPHTLVVEMPHEKASDLEQQFRDTNQIKIEPDSPLSLF